jgi:raffinose/stachyose/melibiose transport system permease protein
VSDVSEPVNISPTRRRRRRSAANVPWLWVLPAVAVVLAFRYVATGAGTWYAFTDWDGLSDATWVGLDNFRKIFEDPASRGALKNTIVLAFSFVITANVIGLALALALQRTIKSRGLLRALFFLPVVMSSLAVSYVWQFIFSYAGPLNGLLDALGLESWKRAWTGDPTWALWTIFVVLVWQFVGLSMVMYLAGLEGIPETGGGPVDASETLATQIYKQTFAFGRFGYGTALSLILTVLITMLAVAQLLILRARERRL